MVIGRKNHTIIEEIRNRTIQGKANKVVELVNQALLENVEVHEIGADGYTDNASSAVDQVKALLKVG